jgi:hypothetical protein
LNVPSTVNHAQVQSALQALVSHHAALRLRCEGAGPETRFIVESAASTPAPTLPVVTILSKHEADAKQEIQQSLANLSDKLNINQSGGMLAAQWIEQSNGSYLLALVIHHFAIDGVSWRILIEDLGLLTQSKQEPSTHSLPAKTMSLKAWGELLALQGKTGARRHEESLWSEQLAQLVALPQDQQIKASDNTLGAGVQHTGHLDVALTERLMRAPAVYHGGINDVLHPLTITQDVNTGRYSALLQRGEGVDLVAGNKDDVRRGEFRHGTIHIHQKPPLDQQGGVIKLVFVPLVDVTSFFKSHQLDPEVADQAQLRFRWGFRAGH